jgi:hypothetical protein
VLQFVKNKCIYHNKLNKNFNFNYLSPPYWTATIECMRGFENLDENLSPPYWTATGGGQ